MQFYLTKLHILRRCFIRIVANLNLYECYVIRMKISSTINLSFKRRLNPNEEAEFSAVLREGKEKLGNTGHSMLIIPTSSLPQKINTGVGNLIDEESMKFFDFAKQYWGINSIQLLPDGNFKSVSGAYLPYSGSVFDLGTHMINLEALTTEEFGTLIRKDELNLLESRMSNRVNYENVLSKNSPVDRVLRKAYDELLKSDTPRKKELISELKNFTQLHQEWLEPKSIFEALSVKYASRDTRDWTKFHHNLYNTDVVSLPERDSVIKELRNGKLAKEMGFYEFKQFLAEKNLSQAKDKLNKKGIKLYGDMLVGFSYDEVWANPKAFVKNSSLKWGLPAVNFDTLEGIKFLRDKVKAFANRYDGIRVDAAWTYITQPIKDNATGNVSKKEYSSKFLEIIEDEIIKVKGKDFNLENVMYEMITSPDEFNIFEGEVLKPEVKNRINIITSYNLNENWGTTSAFKNRGWRDGSYLLGATNHDSLPLRLEFNNVSSRTKQVEVLAEVLKIPQERLNKIDGFIQAKFAEPMKSKHNMFFFTEALNIAERYKDNVSRNEDYRIKLPKNYQEDYFRALQKGEGLNIMDALEKAFVSEGLDKKEAKLYKKIVKFNKILKSSDNIANKNFNWGVVTGLCVGLGAIASIVYMNVNKNKKVGKTDFKVQC